jgi:hypothetical protein
MPRDLPVAGAGLGHLRGGQPHLLPAGPLRRVQPAGIGAVAAYRLSVQAGNPLSERKLAQMFGRTSRRWARARITEARQSP